MKVKEYNQMMGYLTRPSKSTDPKTVKLDMEKHTINMLNIKNMRQDSNIIRGMIMGHSPQFMYNKGINSSNNNRIWRVDIGASKAFGELDDSEECQHRRVQVLVINNDNDFSIVKEKC